MMKIFCVLVVLVSSCTFSHSSICESPGVLRTSDGFAICKYNLDGELTYQSIPCPANTEYSDATNSCEVLKRQKRDASSESDASKESDVSKESDASKESEASKESDASNESDASKSNATKESDSLDSEYSEVDAALYLIEIGSTSDGLSETDLNESDKTSPGVTETTASTTSNPAVQTGSTEQTASGSTESSSGSTEQASSGSTEPTASGSTEQTASGSTEPTASGSTEQTASGSTESTASGSTEQTAAETTVTGRSTNPSVPYTPTTIEPTTSGPNEPAKCRFPGVMCTSCTEGVWCVGTGTVKGGLPFITPVLDVKCNQGEICQDFRGCVSDATNLCTIADFSCTDDGMFPDPYDCTVFHSCVSINGKFIQNDIKCESGAYNAKTGTCGYPLDTPNCINRPVPHCKAQFEMGALPTNPSIYYVCIKKGNTLSPSLFRCSGGTKFTTALFSCV